MLEDEPLSEPELDASFPEPADPLLGDALADSGPDETVLDGVFPVPEMDEALPESELD